VSRVYSGGVSAVKEAGHFDVIKSSSRIRSPGVKRRREGITCPQWSDRLALHL